MDPNLDRPDRQQGKGAPVRCEVGRTGYHTRRSNEPCAPNHQLRLDHAITSIINHAPRHAVPNIGAIVAVGRLWIRLSGSIHYVNGPWRRRIEDPVLRRNNFVQPSLLGLGWQLFTRLRRRRSGWWQRGPYTSPRAGVKRTRTIDRSTPFSIWRVGLMICTCPSVIGLSK